jgi:DNA-binding NarL/FixJ family response regulator
MTKPRILLADDHRMLAEGLRRLLEPEFDLVGIVEDGRALLVAAEKLQPDVIVVDISMPLLNGIEAVRQIKKSHKGIKIVFLTMHPDVTYAASAFEAGASGYVLKHSAPSELIAAITSVLAGQQYVTPLIAGELMEFYKGGGHKQGDDVDGLTPRQREVLQLLAEGRSAKEIATILDISSRTVEFHKYKIMEELGVKTAAELIRLAVKHGLIDKEK